MFDVGQEVVCIDAVLVDINGDSPLVKDRHYFIRWTGEVDKIPCVRVEGIVRPAPKSLIEAAKAFQETEAFDLLSDMPFRASRFAPLVKNKSSTEVMEQLFGGLYQERKIKTPEFA